MKTNDYMKMFVGQFLAKSKGCEGMSKKQCDLLEMEMIDFLENNQAIRDYIYQQVQKECWSIDIRNELDRLCIEVDDNTLLEMIDYYDSLDLEGYSGDFAMQKTFEKFGIEWEEDLYV